MREHRNVDLSNPTQNRRDLQARYFVAEESRLERQPRAALEETGPRTGGPREHSLVNRAHRAANWTETITA